MYNMVDQPIEIIIFYVLDIKFTDVSSAEHFFNLSWIRRSCLNSGPLETTLAGTGEDTCK